MSRLTLWYETPISHRSASVRFYADSERHARDLMRVWLRNHRLGHFVVSATMEVV